VSPVGGQKEPESEEEKRKSRPARVITSVKYRFNGEGFIYDRRPHVLVVSLDGSSPVQITDGDFIDAEPVWAPGGESIVFASARHAARDDDDASDLWRVPAKVALRSASPRPRARSCSPRSRRTGARSPFSRAPG